MKTQAKLLVAAIAVSSIAMPALADPDKPRLKIQRVLKIDPETINKPPQLRASQQSIATIRGQVRGGPVATSVPLTGAAALSSFRLAFGNGDHPVSTISMAKRNDGLADLYLTDTNGDDPFNAYGSWQIIPGGIGGEVSTTIRSGGIFQMPVPPAPVGYRLVLGGFRIFNGGTSDIFSPGDAQIEILSINAHDGFPLPSDNNLSSISGTVRTNNATRPINVMVQYVWIPASIITMTASARNSSPPDQPNAGVRQRSQVLGQLPPTNRYVIKSFDFQYLNGSHNLLSLGIHLDDSPVPFRTAGDAVSFQDNNRDDPISWSVAAFEVN